MKAYSEMSMPELDREYEKEKAAYEKFKAKGMNLNMARGKPGAAQLDLVMDMLTNLQTPEDCMDGNIDARNYGTPMGLPCARTFWAELLGVKYDQVFAAGSSSLTLMYDIISKAYTHGLLHSEKPWCKLEKVKFLCPSPGYDRHFRICATFGMEMIYVPLNEDGPDMNAVEELIEDESVKGIWCVPKYANPAGIVFSDAVVRRMAAMKPAAKDFIIMWDNAYCVHEFEGGFVPFEDILSLCAKNGNPDMVVEFASTSKITLPGAGIAAMAMSKANMDYMVNLIDVQSISYDKMNQLRHVRYLKNKAGVLELMKKHAKVLKPKFDTVLDAFEREIKPLGFGSWNRPKGGYFICLYTMEGTAKRALKLCEEAGIVMTPAGAAFPYGKDPHDSNIRVAPTLPSLDELKAAVEGLCICLKLAALEKLTQKA
ncbi:MAG TPA: aminotransferase class I/II-fold pyridoxal phosphate-dependent enzyme [Clostridia bacterium]|nr:aminotransferase class I/II-fold pyridoxal phosphate-dependent enzyme [Clostridia bacterium]